MGGREEYQVVGNFNTWYLVEFLSKLEEEKLYTLEQQRIEQQEH